MKFRGVEYSAAGAELMRALEKLWRGTDDADEKSRLNNEANVIHAFHASFPGDKAPGLIFHESGRRTEGASNAPVSSEATAEPTSRPETLFGDAA